MKLLVILNPEKRVHTKLERTLNGGSVTKKIFVHIRGIIGIFAYTLLESFVVPQAKSHLCCSISYHLKRIP
jgi:hypothetical protein